MHWYGYDDGSWIWMLLFMVLFWGLIITGVVVVFRSLNRGGSGSSPEDVATAPEQILGERFARGEIDEDEYRKRLDALRESSLGNKKR